MVVLYHGYDTQMPRPRAVVNGLIASSRLTRADLSSLEDRDPVTGGHELSLDPVLWRARRSAFHILNNDLPCGSVSIPEVGNVPAHQLAIHHKIKGGLKLQTRNLAYA